MRMAQGCSGREGTSEAASEVVRQAVGKSCQSGWGLSLSPALGIKETVAGRRLGARGIPSPLPMHPWSWDALGKAVKPMGGGAGGGGLSTSNCRRARDSAAASGPGLPATGPRPPLPPFLLQRPVIAPPPPISGTGAPGGRKGTGQGPGGGGGFGVLCRTCIRIGPPVVGPRNRSYAAEVVFGSRPPSRTALRGTHRVWSGGGGPIALAMASAPGHHDRPTQGKAWDQHGLTQSPGSALSLQQGAACAGPPMSIRQPPGSQDHTGPSQAFGWGAGYCLGDPRGQRRKKVCVPEIGLQFPAPSINFTFCLRKILLMWWGGSGGRGCPGP